MASSRWKRFAFFERQSISIPDAVMNDLAIPDTTTTTNTSRSRSKQQNTLGFLITTAALPLHTKPVAAAATNRSIRPRPNNNKQAPLQQCGHH
jgi:hypothetical protein